MKLSILIVNWNTKELVIKCLRSIFRQEPIFDFEVIVVDNNSWDGSGEALEGLFGGKSNVKIIKATDNLGFARGNNLAYKNSSGEFVLLLNPDTEIKHQALQRMVDFLESSPDVGILGPKIINSDGTIQPSVRRFPDIWSSLLIFSFLHKIFKPKKYLMAGFDYEKISEVDQVMGAALLTRRRITLKLGFLDEKFWLWYEEVDFCKRVKTAGHKIVFYPEAIVMHRGGESFSQFDLYKRKKTLAHSLIYYF
ncbi:MAG: glycosyltransferase family 2 protein [bacterium]|nr:glycosyltransferase family 2 protein [bacterium]